MAAAAPPKDEASRLTALASLAILDTPPEQAFDDLARVAAELCGVPVALVSFVDRDRQWFKARVQVDAVETSRGVSFCARALEAREVLIVADTHADPRFADNPFVTSTPGVRFYAGVPLHVDDGSAVGTLCVLDYVPRELSKTQLTMLQSLARQIASELRLRRALSVAEAEVAKSADAIMPGDRVGGFTLERKIGQGGIGAVFEARGDHGERVAIKVMLREWAAHEDVVSRFVREARILLHLTGAHVCKLFDVGNLPQSRGGLPYLVLEYLEGLDLAHVLLERKRIPWREAVAWMRDACAGVAEAHEHGVIHRDIKPSNVFLASPKDGGMPVIKVLDFGIARADALEGATPGKLTRVDDSLGTPLYMAPEQMLDPASVGPAADVWSMGAVLYELVTGCVPFGGRTMMEICANVLRATPTPSTAHVDDLPIELQNVLDRCLQKKPEKRFGNISELEIALRALVRD